MKKKILKEIIEAKKKNLNKIREDLENIKERIFPVLSLKKSLDEDFGLICEIKRASPSAGPIDLDLDVVKVAEEYKKNGASGISVLTCEKYFMGNINDLKKVKEVVNIPVLMKDFVIDEKQIYQGFLYGADVILLIVRILSDRELKNFSDIVDRLGIECIVEVHNREDIEKAKKIIKRWDNKILGINNRNLETLEIDINTSFDLIKFVLEDKITTISESGIKTAEDILKLRKCNFDGALIGEALLKSEKSGEKVRELLKQKGGD